jgi:beta-amylase
VASSHLREASYIGSVIVEVEVGSGPAGELRYPSYQLDKWSFCGIGEFQSYSPYALTQLQSAAASVGHPEWAYYGGPSNAGSYNSHPGDTGFFSNGADNYRSDYGKFYLGWYSDALLAHGQDILTATNAVFGGALKISVKVSDPGRLVSPCSCCSSSCHCRSLASTGGTRMPLMLLS